jgi:amino acid transporter
MAVDGWLPKALTKLSPKTEVPTLAVICFFLLTAVFVALPFGSLAVIQGLTYTGALVLEFLALFILRVKKPDAARSFRIPGGWLGIAYVCLLPSAFAALVVYATLRDWKSFPGQMIIVAVAAAGGILLYFGRRGAVAKIKLSREIA